MFLQNTVNLGFYWLGFQQSEADSLALKTPNCHLVCFLVTSSCRCHVLSWCASTRRIPRSRETQVLPLSPADFSNFFLPEASLRLRLLPPCFATQELLPQLLKEMFCFVSSGPWPNLTTENFRDHLIPGNRGFTMTSFHLCCFVVELRRSLKARPTTISLKCFRCIHVARFLCWEARKILYYRKKDLLTLQVLWQTIADFLLMPEGQCLRSPGFGGLGLTAAKRQHWIWLSGHCPICLVKHHVDGNLWRRNLVTTEL